MREPKPNGDARGAPLPGPLVPPEVDLRDFDGFMLNVERLMVRDYGAFNWRGVQSRRQTLVLRMEASSGRIIAKGRKNPRGVHRKHAALERGSRNEGQ
ncbi:MAG: hypothetical protein USCAAHI_02374 [Beijerinckiaceae bacterium]|nr:MAG: hypothetical protein USCAAHI_02374 [Beijerinckiaceae bacterium]